MSAMSSDLNTVTPITPVHAAAGPVDDELFRIVVTIVPVAGFPGHHLADMILEPLVPFQNQIDFQ